MSRLVSYPKAMRDTAKERRKELITIDALGQTAQMVVDKETATRVLEFMTELLSKRRSGNESTKCEF